MAARTHFPPFHACTCALVSSTAFYSASLGFRSWSLGQLALAVRIFVFSVLFFSPPFLPDLDALLPPTDSVATLSLLLFLCTFHKAIQYRTRVSRTLLRLSKPKSSLPEDWADPSSRRGERNGLYSCLSCNTAPDCFGKTPGGRYMIQRETDQSITHMCRMMDFCASFTIRSAEPFLV